MDRHVLDQQQVQNGTEAGARVEIRALRHQFGAVEALKAVDLTINAGEFVTLLGPSGCGKTTLLRCLAGLILPKSGEILIGGRPVTQTPVHKRDLGMVFQSYALFPHMSVAENIRFGLKMRGIKGISAEQRTSDALKLVQMQGYEARYPTQLSGGQQQRIALARALVTHPKALLLDEPFGALDAKLRESMQIELRRLQRSLGITTIFVTHDQQEALSMADRVAVMNDGQVDQFDAPVRIYDAPATPFVAEFIGQTNRFRGVAEAHGAEARIRLQGANETIPAGRALSAGRGGVLAMVRPERVAIGPADSAVSEIAFRGEVSDVVFVGEKLSIYVQTAVGPVVASISNAAHHSASAFSPASIVTVSWSRDDMLLFED